MNTLLKLSGWVQWRMADGNNSAIHLQMQVCAFVVKNVTFTQPEFAEYSAAKLNQITANYFIKIEGNRRKFQYFPIAGSPLTIAKHSPTLWRP